MADRNLLFSNIVSTPTLNSWAQAYNAGKLFAVLSLTGDIKEEAPDDESLGAIGKKLLNTLEQEFFTLEAKDLNSIKTAVEATITKVPDNIETSFVIAAIINNIAYLFVLNKGKINLKREDRIGTIIDGANDSNKLKASSGFLKDKDILILQTDQFTNLVSNDRLSSSLDHQPPNEISETLAPFVHEAQEGGAAAIIIEYKEEKITEEEKQIEEPDEKEEFEPVKEKLLEEEEKEQEEKQNEEDEKKTPFFYSIKEKIKFPILRVNHAKKIYLTIAVVILIVLASSIFMAYKNQQDTRLKAIYNQYYPEAEKKFQEGEALIELNQGLARDNFTAAKNLLNTAKDKLPNDSSQEKSVAELLAKVETGIKNTSGIATSNAKEADSGNSILLAFEKNNKANYFYVYEKDVYYIDSKGVSKNDGISTKTIIKNDNAWDNIGGFGIYFGNVYVLDKQNGIIKFASGSYAKSDYFSGTAPNLTKANALAIDGSIWVLFSNGDIKKYTKGKEDSFKVTGLDSKFSNATRIYTDIDSDNVYILDNGNRRIVVLGKNGSYKAQYQSEIIKGASDFDVKEGDKKIYVLSSGKIFEINLK
jgi:hypothetical protein